MTDSRSRTREQVQAHSGASADTIAAFRAARDQGGTREGGIAIRSRTCNDPAQMVPFREAGLRAVITDNPSLFLG